MSSDRPLAGRHAIVTGGSRGIGAAIAERLAADGAAITLLGRDVAALDRVAHRIRTDHEVAVAPAECDVVEEAVVQRVFADAADRLGHAHILVNNAGQSEGAPFLDTSVELWQRMLAVNLTGAFLCTRQVVGAMLDARSGRIVNIASTTALRGYRNTAAYAAAKHGLIGLTRALAAEVARHGITVNAVCPGYTSTDMAERAVHNIMRDMERSEQEARTLIARTIQRGTLIEPQEIADAVAWLCSPGAAAVNGQVIAVAGGEV